MKCVCSVRDLCLYMFHVKNLSGVCSWHVSCDVCVCVRGQCIWVHVCVCVWRNVDAVHAMFIDGMSDAVFGWCAWQRVWIWSRSWGLLHHSSYWPCLNHFSSLSLFLLLEFEWPVVPCPPVFAIMTKWEKAYKTPGQNSYCGVSPHGSYWTGMNSLSLCFIFLSPILGLLNQNNYY